MRKADVRRYAHEKNLPVASKPESQEVCFAPKGDYAAFVERHADGLKPRSGSIIDRSGREVGRHDGVHRFTVGQRRGLGVSAAEPLYVTGIDPASATVTVGRKNDVIVGGLVAARPNWLSDTPGAGARVRVKIRSRFAAVDAEVLEADDRQFTIRAEEGLPAVTPGQAAVLYDGDRVLGGGWIERALSRAMAPAEALAAG
jgi:tRNA-specific 2-thiouridylase